jgi:hypothetical protein
MKTRIVAIPASAALLIGVASLRLLAGEPDPRTGKKASPAARCCQALATAED